MAIRSLLLMFVFVFDLCFACNSEYGALRIVPDVIKDIPEGKLEVSYNSRGVNCGDKFSKSLTASEPKVTFDADEKKFYTLALVDLDAPFPGNNIYAEFLHWLVPNIEGAKLGSGKKLGEALTEYMGPSPPKPEESSGNDCHRYVFLLFEHETPVTISKPKGRIQFHVADMAKTNGLGKPKAGNFMLVCPN